MRNVIRPATVRTNWIILLLLSSLVLNPAGTMAQATRDRRDQPSGKQLEVRIEKAEDALVLELSDVASELYKQGAREKSLEVLEKLQRIKPDLPAVQQKIDEIKEELMSDNEMDIEFDVSRGWGTALAEVGEEKPFRMVVTGDYRMTLSATVPVSGLPTKDSAQDHLAEAAFGAVVGVIVTDGQPGKPFAIPDMLQMTPKKSGQLFIRVNVPASARCTGKLDVKLSGYVLPVAKKR